MLPFSLITGLKPVVSICRSYGTFFPNKYSFVSSFLITGLKPVVIICRSSGTFFKKGDNNSDMFFSVFSVAKINQSMNLIVFNLDSCPQF